MYVDIKKLEGYNNIYVVDAFEKEFLTAVGFERKKYLKNLKSQLYNLERLTPAQMIKPQFEFLEEIDSFRLFCIRERSKLNLRIIYIYFENQKIIVLACAFKEKHKGDYHHAKDVAVKRMKALKRRLEEIL